MINTDDYMKFVSDPLFPEENKEGDLWFLFQDKMLLVKRIWERLIFRHLRM